MLDHILLNVPSSRFDEAITWYTSALACLGYTRQMFFPGHAAGFGPSPSSAKFWLAARDDLEGKICPTHVGFSTKEHAVVQRFFDDAVKAGGKANGEPGLRTMYHDKYYAAFVLDPFGNNIEVVNHGLGKESE